MNVCKYAKSRIRRSGAPLVIVPTLSIFQYWVHLFASQNASLKKKKNTQGPQGHSKKQRNHWTKRNTPWEEYIRVYEEKDKNPKQKAGRAK